MDPLLLGLGSVVVLLILVMAGAHIAVALTAVSLVTLVLLMGSLEVAMNLLATSLYFPIRESVFSVVPLFLFIGVLVGEAGIGRDLFALANRLLGWLRGGVGMATILANGLMAAIVGTSVASAATFSKIAYRPLVAQGYEPRLALGLISGSSVLGMLIPPSLLFILYGILTETSIGQLFVAGVVPGILLVVVYMVGLQFLLPRTAVASTGPATAPAEDPHPVSDFEALDEVVQPRSWLGVSLPFIAILVVMIGGIYGGIFTPTESASVGAVAALAVSLGTGRLKISDLPRVFRQTALTTGAIFILFVGAQLYSRMLALTGVIEEFGVQLQAWDLGQLGSLLVLVLVMLLMGMIVDSTSIILLLAPFLVKFVALYGVDPLWLGVVSVIAVEVGLITPPFGMCAFTVKSAVGGQVSVEDVFRGSLPFILMMLVTLALIIAVPEIATWLPRTMQ